MSFCNCVVTCRDSVIDVGDFSCVVLLGGDGGGLGGDGVVKGTLNVLCGDDVSLTFSL